jgi:uroporphyrinogen decarboxylase
MTKTMSPRERFVAALNRQSLVGRVPHFELEFCLTMEEFGKVHPSHRNYAQWQQMKHKERHLHLEDMASIYVAIAERFEHSAILLHDPGDPDAIQELVDLVREKSGNKYFLMMHGDATYSIPSGGNMEAFSYRMVDDPVGVKAEAEQNVANAFKRAEWFKKHSNLDGFALCADYCLNTGPFLSPSQFSEFVTPYLAKLIKGYREMGFYTIKHTDGNIMPIIDQLVESNPHALHSLDPQAGVDIADVKKKYGKRVCLIGNVNCGLMDTGTDEEVRCSARYAMTHGMPGGGYIFSTSNCIYTGMRLERYETILEVWRQMGNYE